MSRVRVSLNNEKGSRRDHLEYEPHNINHWDPQKFEIKTPLTISELPWIPCEGVKNFRDRDPLGSAPDYINHYVSMSISRDIYSKP